MESQLIIPICLLQVGYPKWLLQELGHTLIVMLHVTPSGLPQVCDPSNPNEVPLILPGKSHPLVPPSPALCPASPGSTLPLVPPDPTTRLVPHDPSPNLAPPEPTLASVKRSYMSEI